MCRVSGITQATSASRDGLEADERARASMKTFLYLLGLIGAGVLVGWLLSRSRPVVEEKPAAVATIPAAPVSQPAPLLAPISTTREPEATPPAERPVMPSQAKPEKGTGENQLEHMLRSVVTANADQLKLTPAQVDRLAADYLEFQEVYAEQAKRFLQETGFDPAGVSLRLPAYPVEGKLLRDMFYQRLDKDFPSGKSGEIKEQIGGFLENSFRGFGMNDQTFTVTRSSEAPGAFEVRWVSRPPETASDNDPTKAVPAYVGGEGTTLLYREQIESGEFRFLAPVLERRFPMTAGEAK